MIKKSIIIFLLIIFLSLLLHTIALIISTEFYTKFRFNQYGISSKLPMLLGVIVVAIKTSWINALVIALAMPLIDKLLNKDLFQIEDIKKLVAFVYLLTFAFAVLGIIIGQKISKYPTNLNKTFMSPDLKDLPGLLMCSLMIGFAVIGTYAGMLIYIVQSIRAKRKR